MLSSSRLWTTSRNSNNGSANFFHAKTSCWFTVMLCTLSLTILSPLLPRPGYRSEERGRMTNTKPLKNNPQMLLFWSVTSDHLTQHKQKYFFSESQIRACSLNDYGYPAGTVSIYKQYESTSYPKCITIIHHPWMTRLVCRQRPLLASAIRRR